MLSLCQDIWLHLNQTDLQPLPGHLARIEPSLDFPAVLRYSRKTLTQQPSIFNPLLMRTELTLRANGYR